MRSSRIPGDLNQVQHNLASNPLPAMFRRHAHQVNSGDMAVCRPCQRGKTTPAGLTSGISSGFAARVSARAFISPGSEGWDQSNHLRWGQLWEICNLLDSLVSSSSEPSSFQKFVRLSIFAFAKLSCFMTYPRFINRIPIIKETTPAILGRDTETIGSPNQP